MYKLKNVIVFVTHTIATKNIKHIDIINKFKNPYTYAYTFVYR